jgi:hypothetical protein
MQVPMPVASQRNNKIIRLVAESLRPTEEIRILWKKFNTENFENKINPLKRYKTPEESAHKTEKQEKLK